jgi:hypothetical protein
MKIVLLNRKIRFLKRNITVINLLILVVLILGCNGCGVSKKQIENEKNLTETSINKNEIEKDTRHKLPDQNVRDPRKPHPDSIAKWNAQVFAEQEKYKVLPDENTKFFTIDPNTGEVKGCPLIKLKGVLDEKYYAEEKKERDSLKQKFELIKPSLRSVIMHDSNELWYGDPKNVEIEGTPEAVHSGRGPTGYIFNKLGTRLIVPVGYPHGGTMQEIYFFDNNNNLLAKHKLDKAIDMPYVDLNDEETFVIVSNGVSGDFYFFTIDGKLERKGNFNELTGDKGNSYGYNYISETGKYWLLSNNLDYVFDRSGNILHKFNIGGNCFIDEKNNRIFFTYGSKISIFSLSSNSLKYQSDFWLGDNIGFFHKNILIINNKSKNFIYEINL